MGVWMFKFLFLLQVAAAISPEATAAASTAPARCIEQCGDVAIPYPFGVGKGCFGEEYGDFNIVCNGTTTYLNTGNIEVLNISLAGQVRVKGWMGHDCYTRSGGRETSDQWFTIRLGPYTFSHTQNKFVVIGCDTVALLGSRDGVKYSGGCITFCDSLGDAANGSCSGAGCCKAPVPRGVRNFSTVHPQLLQPQPMLRLQPVRLRLRRRGEPVADLSDPEFVLRPLPIVLDWSIGKETCEEARRKPGFACRGGNSECFESNNGVGYVCNCSQGYEGNPYLSGPRGCQDIDECRRADIYPCNGTCKNTLGSYICTCPQGTTEGPSKGVCIFNSTAIDIKNKEIRVSLKLGLGVGIGLVCLIAVMLGACWGLQRKLLQQRRKITDLKMRLFEQNGGPFLQEYISSQPSNTFRIFSEEELANATNNFQEDQVIGRGGHGIVYKGKLENNTEVAIKKSKMVDERQRKEFARETAILSQINHVNIVKLLGCCLEVEIPMLVYEFVQCGTLFDFIHRKRHTAAGPIPLGTRLRIAEEAAEALAYLHSYASPPILHGDVKTTNILLDEDHRAKVSDFGASTLAPTDETQLATVVQGTCGYLDPEYLHTYQLTAKSDVYSFGVVLVELLTGKKPLHLEGPEEERGLAMNFVSSMNQNRLTHILDAEVLKEGETERLWEIAELACRCLSMKGEDRPTMREVAMALHVLGSSKEHPWVVQHRPEEAESLLGVREPSAYEINSDTTARYASMGNHAMFEIESGRSKFKK
ncbi:hypothetical protein Taro_008059 [Colocasia esculenta]|uniref:Protein kinase domain-containing protein n=1 Tax=Colocasia esculenta TaxID=4460 RepID=A0A843U236_COLES|nr:hypothetical protein [Colocasia esculenta]